MTVDYTPEYKDYAKFLPAISEMIAKYITQANPKRKIEDIKDWTDPAKEDDKKSAGLTQKSLDYLEPKNGLFHVPYSLYSAGQAAKGNKDSIDMVTGRDRNNPTIILGDSGGFQIQQGSIKFKGDATRERMLRWLETYCEWSMILDFPTGGIDMGTTDQHFDRLSGITTMIGDYKKKLSENEIKFKYHELFENKYASLFDDDKFIFDPNNIKQEDKLVMNYKVTKTKTGDYVREPLKTPITVNIIEFIELQDDMNVDNNQERGLATCLFQTLINNDYFIKHRTPGATKFLNVMQGRTNDEASRWFAHVKDYDFEGWSLAGPHKEKFDMTLLRLLQMKEHDGFKNKDWLHILGVGKLANGCAYTTMQRMIREHYNPNFTISYDVSSPFTTAAYGNIFIGYTLDKNGWSIQSTKLDHKDYLAKNLSETNPKPNNLFLEETFNIYVNDYGKNRNDILNLKAERNIDGLRDRGRLCNQDPTKTARFVDTEIGKHLRMRDLSCNDDPKFNSTWDMVSYAMLMHHNVQMNMEAVFDSQKLYDNGDLNRVPLAMLELKDAIIEILDPSLSYGEALEAITKHTTKLHCLVGDKVSHKVQLDGNLLPGIVSNNEHKAELEKAKEAIAIKAHTLEKVSIAGLTDIAVPINAINSSKKKIATINGSSPDLFEF